MKWVDPTRRFSDRAENYARYRPGYPDEVIDVLAQETGLTPEAVIADIGSGTGISSELFLRHGCAVHAVEPNPAMREAAERRLRRYTHFHSVDATAEASTLPDQSVTYVVACQAFHWFEPEKAKQEWSRILRPGGWAVLLWNARSVSTPFLRGYESLLQQYGTDYREVRRRNVNPSRVAAFFAPGGFQMHTLYNEQRLDLEALKGRLLSSSYVPSDGHPKYRPMMEELVRLFEQHQEAGTVCIEYDVEMYLGRLRR